MNVQLYLDKTTQAGGPITTAADGTYTFPSIPTGFTVSVGFTAAGYVPQWWNDKPSAETADVVPITGGQTTTGIDAVLQPETTTGDITGHVTDAATGQPLSSVTVTATNSATGQATSVSDGTDGAYLFTALAPGSYTVEFTNSSYVDQWWNNEPSQATADQVTVTAAQTVPNINANLAPSYSPAVISGTVTNSAGQPVVGASVLASCTASGQPVSATTGADGTYTIRLSSSPSPGGSCTVSFDAFGYVEQAWNDKPVFAGDPISVSSPGQTVTGIDAVLQPVPALSGIVSGASGGSATPLAGATVVVHNYYGFTVTQTTTAADGTWSVGNLRGGVYRVEFQPPPGSGLLGQWWNNEPDLAHSNGVGVTAGFTTTGINATLTSGATVSGTVTDTSGPVAGASVAVFAVNSSNAPGTEVAHTTTATDGTYNIAGLQAGSYDVLVDPPAGSADVGQWYNNSPTAGGATTVTLATSGTATANAQLTAGQRGSIAGMVTDGSGSPIASTTVLAVAADGRTTTTATTAADGTYTINNLDVGIYTVWFLPPAGSTYQGSVWNLAAGKVVPLTIDQGGAITGINATLSQN